MRNIILVFISLLLFNSPQFYSQITLQVGGGLGYISPAGDYSGSTVDFYNGTKYGMNSGFNLHAKARVGLLGLNLFGIIDYSTISGDGKSEPGQGTIENSHSIFSLKAGPEFNLSIPLSPVGVYFDGFVSVNTFSGKVKFQGVAQVPSGDYDIKSETRFGVGAGGGVLLDILPVVTLDFGIHYNLYNLFGQSYTSIVTINPKRVDAYTSLNDDKDPAYGIDNDIFIVDDSRSINAWQFTITAMIGI
ncbi:MAG: outer membrane beta-barrel protein [Ignavibacteriaceae bacterium]|nr:outer membrane beta-barrel protein [Ignavibacteriaceae bacterium]MCW8823970.1 outer membrane beta-barrel protein [Ignavibacteriaceae bacterium]